MPHRCTKKMIWVTFQHEGVHAYPEAPEAVSYLRHPHRHVFQFKVALEVEHNERDVEFHMLKRELTALYADGTIDHNNKSCETIADELAKEIQRRYPGRCLQVEVSEDGENGVELTFEPELDGAHVR